MSEQADDLIKRREISFSTLQPKRQACSAARDLARLAGVLRVEVLGETLVEIEYDLRSMTLKEAEETLESLGYHLDNNLLHRVKRALYRYTEETQRANLACAKSGESISTQKAFITSYGRRDHGCRDDRPNHWRRYL